MSEIKKEFSEQDIVNFLSDLEYRYKIYFDAKKESDKSLSSEFNIFETFEPNENMISEVIEDILKVNGSHGQGDVFLRNFCNICLIKSSMRKIYYQKYWKN